MIFGLVVKLNLSVTPMRHLTIMGGIAGLVAAIIMMSVARVLGAAKWPQGTLQ
jgi:hypothetical protein